MLSGNRAAARNSGGISGKLSGGAGAKGGKSKVDLAKLFATMDGRSGGDRFKLDKKGTVRFRLVQPLGDDDVPMIPADEHWLPYVKDDGKEGKRQAHCYDLIGQTCPFCILSGLLQSSKVAALEEMGKDIRPSRRWLMYVVNRSYMMTQESPHAIESMEKIEKAPLPQTVAQAIVQLMRNRSWGDPTDPVTGYDIEVTGKPKGGSDAFVDYSVSPVPRDGSPAYDLKMTASFQPLSTLLEFKSDEDCMKLIEPILATLATEGFSDIIDAFWDAMEAAPSGGENADDDIPPDEGESGDENYGASVRPEMGEDVAGEDVGDGEGEYGDGEGDGDGDSGDDAGSDGEGDDAGEEAEAAQPEVAPAPPPILRRPAPGAPQPEAGKRRSGAAVTMARTTSAKASVDTPAPSAAKAPAVAASVSQAAEGGKRGGKLLDQLRRNKK